MNCKKCKHCKKYVSNLSLKFGNGHTYLCDVKNSVVGRYDATHKKEYWREYQMITHKCTNFEEKAVDKNGAEK